MSGGSALRDSPSGGRAGPLRRRGGFFGREELRGTAPSALSGVGMRILAFWRGGGDGGEAFRDQRSSDSICRPLAKHSSSNSWGAMISAP
jgi:hypothetical protein